MKLNESGPHPPNEVRHFSPHPRVPPSSAPLSPTDIEGRLHGGAGQICRRPSSPLPPTLPSLPPPSSPLLCCHHASPSPSHNIFTEARSDEEEGRLESEGWAWPSTDQDCFERRDLERVRWATRLLRQGNRRLDEDAEEDASSMPLGGGSAPPVLRSRGSTRPSAAPSAAHLGACRVDPCRPLFSWMQICAVVGVRVGTWSASELSPSPIAAGNHTR